jgi:hypothetical protein
MSNIDEKGKDNFTIEMRIFENYEKVKHEIIKVIDFLRHAETNLGMCRIFDNQNHEFWHSVIKPWFKPERFGITHLWFLERFSYMGYGKYHIIRGNRLWCIEIQKYYVFFYEVRNGRRIIGKNKIKEILNILL